MTLQALFAQAAGLHQQGKLVEAERLYLQVLQQDPQSIPGQHLLGVLRSQQGRNSDAIALIGAALEGNPKDFGALLNYGLVLQRERRFDEALAAYDRALAVRPDFVEAHFNRAGLLQELHRPEEALTAYDKTLALRPNFVEAHYNRGVLLQEMNRYEEALAAYDGALVVNPKAAAALGNRGNVLRELKRLPEALASYDKALALDSRLAVVLLNRGITLCDMQRFAEALASLDAALAADPGRAATHYSRGVALAGLSRFDEALAAYDRALALIPSYAQALNDRGVALWNLKRFDEALTSYDKAVALNPGFAEAWYNRGGLLYEQRRHDEALASYDKVLALQTGNAKAWNGRGSALWAMERAEEALASFDKAIALDPGYAEPHANRAVIYCHDREQYQAAAEELQRVLAIDPDWPYARGELLHTRMLACDWRDYDTLCAAVDEAVRAGKRAIRPFAYQAISQSPADLKACSVIFARDLYPAVAPVARRARPHDRIRIGYVSGEFRDQATVHLMAGVYEQHDRNKFDIVGFDTGWHEDGAVRKRLEAAFGGFIDIATLSDQAAAERIAEAGIDILVNLNGYFGDQRMGVFARRPAPVQVNYLGFPATLGADCIDYILADRIVIPEGEKQFYSEKVVWLPDTYQANDSKRPIAAGTLTRREAGLPDTGFVFCNFNQTYKLTPDCFAAWMRILQQVEDSVLWLWHGKEAQANLQREAEARGVATGRLLFASSLPLPRHLARLKLADLFLDSWPYNAHTTASDALWAGVPLLTCRGKVFAGRVAVSLLAAAGLPELIMETTADYERRAVELAQDAASLSSLRNKLAQNRLNCALFDTERFRRNLEAAFAKMWDIYRRGEAPHGFAV